MGPEAARLLGDFNESPDFMTAANGNSVKVTGARLVNYSFRGVSREIPTRYIESLKHDCIFGSDSLRKFGMCVDFHTSMCSLPGGKEWKISFPSQSDGSTAAVMDSISVLDSTNESRFFLTLTIKGQKVTALVDSGSTRTYLGPVFEQVLQDSIIPVSASVLLADNSVEPVLGEVNTQLTLAGKRKALPVRLVHSLSYDCILGIDFLKTFGIKIDFGKSKWQFSGESGWFDFDPALGKSCDVSGDFAGLQELTYVQRGQIADLIRKHVKEPGKKLAITKLARHKIELSDPTPIRQNSRRVSPALLKEMQKLVDSWLEEDVIEPCKSPWCSPPVMARKSGGVWRLCVDYRKLNARTKKHAHPLPNIDSLLDKFTNARYISKIDMTWAFLQVVVEEKCRDYTAFSMPGRGQFRFKRMPFGLTNSPSTYQAMMDVLIQSLPDGAAEHIFAYLDDLCIVTETFEEHIYWLEVLLKALGDANLQISPAKSEFCCSQVKYLGYIVDSKGLHVDLEKVEAIEKYPALKNLRQLRRVLGMVGWYSRFMADYSLDKVSLCDLLRKGVKWSWTEEHDQAFRKIKKDLTYAPVLIRPDFSKEFQLHCDASDYAIGAVLTQVREGEQHPIIFINRLLTSSERKYTTTEKEFKAVLWAVEKLRAYLEGFSFTVYTDHSSLLWLQNLNCPSGRLARWAMALSAHDMKIVHRPGAQNQVPDALSRAFESSVCSAEELVTKDAWYANQFKKVLNSPDQFPDWKIQNKKLFVHKPDPWVDPLLGDRDAWKLAIPLKLKVLRECHDSPTSGHFGNAKTHSLLVRHYFWPGMRIDCARFVRGCEICQKVKHSNLGPQGLMQVKSHQETWSVLVADLQGPFPPPHG